MREESNSSAIIWLSVIACFLSNISQLPYFVTKGRTQLVCFPVWVILFVVLIIKNRGALTNKVLPFFALSSIFMGGIIFNNIITTNDYFSSSLLYSFFISAFIFVIGALSSKYFSRDLFVKIIVSFIVSVLIVSISIYFSYFGIGYNLNSRVYGYASKNSFAQLVFIAIVLLLCAYNPEKKVLKFLKVIVLLFEFLLIILLRSRATLIGLLVAIFIIAISKNTNRKLKFLICSSCIVITFLILTNESFYNLVFNNVLFAGRDSSDLDSLSSGRVSILSSFPELIENHWLTGIGSKYFECFPLSAILQFGLGSGFVLIILSLYPVFWSWMYRKRNVYIYYLFLIALGFAIDGLFEGLAPFGPGIKCYFLWYMFGLLISKAVSLGESVYAKE